MAKRQPPAAPAQSAVPAPLTYPELLDRAWKRVSSARGLLDETIERVKRLVHEEFVHRGGCPTCRGRGWVVTWDTLDCMDGSCAEYGACPQDGCTPATRKASGLDVGTTMYDRNRGVVDPVQSHPAYLLLCASLQTDLAGEIVNCDALKKRCDPRKGDRVVVARGRKVPVGTVSRVAFVGEGGHGAPARVLLKDEAVWQDRQANGRWIASHNVDVLVPRAEAAGALSQAGYVTAADMLRVQA